MRKLIENNFPLCCLLGGIASVFVAFLGGVTTGSYACFVSAGFCWGIGWTVWWQEKNEE